MKRRRKEERNYDTSSSVNLTAAIKCNEVSLAIQDRNKNEELVNRSDDTKDKTEEKRALEDFTDFKFGGLKSETQEKGKSWKKRRIREERIREKKRGRKRRTKEEEEKRRRE